MNKTEKLRELANEIVACKVCNDLASQATQLVMGFGNSNAKLVLIGEAPGAHEDREGRPFIGAAGKLLGDNDNVSGKKFNLSLPLAEPTSDRLLSFYGWLFGLLLEPTHLILL